MGKRLAGTLMPLVLSVVIIWAVGLVPRMEEKGVGRRDGIAVFSGDKPAVLSEANLVDWLSALPGQLELKHAEWDGNTLLLDYRANAKEMPEDRLYGAVTELVITGLAGTENVNRLRIRVFDPYAAPGDRRVLVLALEAGREAFEAGAYETWLGGGWTPEDWLSRHFRMTGPKR
jgi:hypothetical protein